MRESTRVILAVSILAVSFAHAALTAPPPVDELDLDVMTLRLENYSLYRGWDITFRREGRDLVMEHAPDCGPGFLSVLPGDLQERIRHEGFAVVRCEGNGQVAKLDLGGR